MKSPDSKTNDNSSRASANQAFGDRCTSLLSHNIKNIIQPKLTVNQHDDIYEKEANFMADKVVQELNDATMKKQTGHGPENSSSFIQTKKNTVWEEEEEVVEKEKELLPEESLQRKPVFDSNPEPPDEKKRQPKFTPFRLKEELHAKADFDTGDVVSPAIENQLVSSKGLGSTLPPNIREQMESSFVADFTNVFVHNDNTAIQMNKALNAQAFTYGNDIYFNEHKYNPEDTSGKLLLAHELTHVVQQRHNENGEMPALKRQEDVERGTFTYDWAPTYHIFNDIQWHVNFIRGQVDLILTINDDKKNNLAPELVASTSVLILSNDIGLNFNKDSQLKLMRVIVSRIKSHGEPMPNDLWVSFDAEDFKSYFDSGALNSYFHSIRNEETFSEGALLASGDFLVGKTKEDEIQQPEPWMRTLEKKLKGHIKETKIKEPASIDLPDKNVRLHFDKSEKKWKISAYQKEKGKKATHFVLVDFKEGDTEDKILEKTRREIREEISKDDRNTVTIDGQQQVKDKKFKWAFDWVKKLQKIINDDRGKSRGLVENLPDKISLVSSSTEPDVIYLSVSVFADNRMLLDDVRKIESDIEKIKTYSDDLSYTPTYGIGVTLKSATVPEPLQKDLDPKFFLDFYIRPYISSMRHSVSEIKQNKDKTQTYERVLQPYPAYIKPVNVRPDFQSVTGASQIFHMIIDIASVEKSVIVERSIYFNPIYYTWRIYDLNTLLSTEELAKFSSDWQIRRIQLLAYFKESAQLKSGPLENEVAMTQRKLMESTFPSMVAGDKKPMFYGDSGLDSDGEFTLPNVPGDYLVYCSAQTEPFGNTIQMPSEAFFPIKLREGYDLAQETLIKYRNPELTKLEQDLNKTNDVAEKQQINEKINKITSTTLRDTTDENKTGTKITDANERIRIAKKLDAIYREWNRDNDKLISNDLDFRLLIAGDQEDGKAIAELWTNVIKRKSGWVIDNIKTYIEDQSNSIKGIKALHSRIKKFDDNIDYTQPVYTPNLILISNETGQEYQLISILGYEKKSMLGKRFARVVLIDVSTSETQKAYYSDTYLDKDTATEQDFIDAAPQAFEDLAGTCKYGEGYIAYEVPGLSTVRGLISGECSTGQKFLNVLGKLALIAGIAALVLGTIATGGALGVIAAGLGIASAVVGAALSGKNISDRIANHTFKFDVEFALDVINILGPLTMGASALARTSKLGLIDRGITDITQLSKAQGLIKLERGIALYQKAEMGTNFILTNYKLLEDLEKINNMNIPEEQKDVLRRELIANGILGNMMFASSVAQEYHGSPAADAAINESIMNADTSAYRKANIEKEIYTPDGEFNTNYAKEHGIPEIADKVTADTPLADTTPGAAEHTQDATHIAVENAQPESNTHTSPIEPSGKTSEPRSSHEVPNTATRQAHEHKIEKNGAITRCTENCSPLSLDMNARAKMIKSIFGKEHPNYEKAAKLSKSAAKIEAQSKRAAKLGETKRKAKETEIYSKADELERSMAVLENEMVSTLQTRSAENVSGMQTLLESYPDQKSKFENKLTDLESKQKEIAAKASDPDPEISKAAWDDLAAIDKVISRLKKDIVREINNISRPDISERYEYDSYTAGNGDRVKYAKGELGIPGKVREVRDKTSQENVSEGTGDDAGHLIANIFGGAGHEKNLGAQNWESNRFGTWKELENYWSNKLKDGTTIFVTVEEFYRPNSDRPYKRVARWKETDPAGTVTNHELDFGNFHTRESRDAQNIPATPGVPAEGGQVIIWNAERAKRGLPEYHGENTDS